MQFLVRMLGEDGWQTRSNSVPSGLPVVLPQLHEMTLRICCKPSSDPRIRVLARCCSSVTSLETTQPIVPESLCPSPGSLLIPDDLDSTRCQQSRSEDLEHLPAATKSPNRLLGDRIVRAVWEYAPGNVSRVYRRRLPFPRSREGCTVCRRRQTGSFAVLRDQSSV